MSSRMSRSAEPKRNSASVFASSVFPGAGRPGEQKHGDRPAGIGQAGLEHRDPVDDGLDGLVLADDARAKKRADRGEIDPLAIVEHQLRHAGELGQRRQHVLAPHRGPSCAATRCAVSLRRSSAAPGIWPVPR